MKITIVEDEEILLRVLKEKFENAKFDVSTVADGERAMVVIREVQPDIVLLDLILPKKNGFEVLQEVKSDPKVKSIPVIVLSNLGQDEDIKKALQIGADDYIVKTQHPINEIIDKVKARLNIHSK